jgi:hypothetical protein
VLSGETLADNDHVIVLKREATVNTSTVPGAIELKSGRKVRTQLRSRGNLLKEGVGTGFHVKRPSPMGYVIRQANQSEL